MYEMVELNAHIKKAFPHLANINTSKIIFLSVLKFYEFYKDAGLLRGETAALEISH